MAKRLGGWLSWACCLSLGLSLFYTLFYVAGSFGFSFWVLSNRSMVEHHFNNTIISTTWDQAVWSATILVALAAIFHRAISVILETNRKILAILAFIAGIVLVGFGLFSTFALAIASILAFSFALLSIKAFGVSRFSFLKRILFGAVPFSLLIELAGLALANFPFAFIQLPVSVHWQIVELNLSNLSYPLLPYGYLLLVLAGIAAFMGEIASGHSLPKKLTANRLGNLATRIRGYIESLKACAIEPLSGRLPLMVAVLFSFLVSIFLVFLTVSPWVNPTNRLVSVDAPVYYQRLTQMQSLDTPSAISYALNHDRTIFMLLSYGLSFVFSTDSILQFMPALLVPLFCVVSFFLVKGICNFKETWVYAMLLAPFSIQALALLYSGYFANMLAVIFVFSYFVVFLKTSRLQQKWRVPILIALSLLVFFSHSWTWYIFAFSLAAYLIMEWQTSRRETSLRQTLTWKTYIVASTILVGLITELLRTYLNSSGAYESVFEAAHTNFGLPNAGTILGGLNLTTSTYLGGVFANETIIALSIIGFLFMLTFKTEISRMLLSWFLVGCVAVIFASGELIFNRFLFMMPSLVFSSLGLSFIVRMGVYGSRGNRRRKILEAIVVGLVFLLLFNFALRFVSNLNAS